MRCNKAPCPSRAGHSSWLALGLALACAILVSCFHTGAAETSPTCDSDNVYKPIKMLTAHVWTNVTRYERYCIVLVQEARSSELQALIPTFLCAAAQTLSTLVRNSEAST